MNLNLTRISKKTWIIIGAAALLMAGGAALIIPRLGGGESGSEAGGSGKSRRSAASAATDGPTPGANAAGDGSGSTSGSAAPAIPLPPPDNVSYSIGLEDFDDPKPVDCSMIRGEVCTMHLRGRYRLVNHDAGIIRVSVFENENETASKYADLAVKKGSSEWFIDFRFRVGDKAEKEVIQVDLLTAAEVPLHRAPSKYPYFRVRG